MDIYNNDNNPNLTVTTTQPPPNNFFKNTSNLIFIAITLALLITTTLVGRAYFLEKKINTTNNLKIKTIETKLVNQSTKQARDNDLSLFEHPDLHYNLEYPITWKSTLNGKNQYNVSNRLLKLENVEHKAFYIENEPHPVIESGCEIITYTEDISEKTIDVYFKNNSDKINPENRTDIIVDSVKAIQFDNNSPKYNLFETWFIKNNRLYAISYQFPLNKKNICLADYSKILDSFKAK